MYYVESLIRLDPILDLKGAGDSTDVISMRFDMDSCFL